LIAPVTFRRQFKLHLRKALRHLAHNECGQALVETALTMLILLSLILGVMDLCLALYSYHYLANAAHETARYAIVRGATWGTSCGSYTASMCTASPTDIANFVASRNFPGITITADDVCVQYFSSVSASTASTCTKNTANSGPNAVGNIVMITITYPFSFGLPGLGTYTYHLSSTSRMVIAN